VDEFWDTLELSVGDAYKFEEVIRASEMSFSYPYAFPVRTQYEE